LTYLNSIFEVKSVLYAGVDGAIVKANVEAKSVGEIDSKYLGI
jgi:hypothetical protein